MQVVVLRVYIVYTYIYICNDIHTYICTYAHISYIYIYIYVLHIIYTYICICTYACLCICTVVYIYIYMYYIENYVNVNQTFVSKPSLSFTTKLFAFDSMTLVQKFEISKVQLAMRCVSNACLAGAAFA